MCGLTCEVAAESGGFLSGQEAQARLRGTAPRGWAIGQGAHRAAEAALKNGTKFGPPRKVEDTEHIATARRMKADGHTGKDIAKFLRVSRATLHRYLTEDGATLIGRNLTDLWSRCRDRARAHKGYAI